MESQQEIKIHESHGYTEAPIEGEIDLSDKPTPDVTEAIEKDIVDKETVRPRWCPSSKLILQQSEEQILKSLKTPYNGRFIDIGPVGGCKKKDCKIWTVSFNEDSKEIPLVLLHGFGAGVGFWALNMKELSQSRPVHAIDILGFARSSRPKFSSNPEEAENEIVDSIEAWRIAMNLEKFAIVGHSFGGYLSTCYSMRYPNSVGHLILADPWGMKDKPKDLNEIERFRNIPFFAKMLVRVLGPLNPLSGMRLAGGHYGPKIIQSARSDLIMKFESVVEDSPTTLAKYIYHCNAQNPTGESAFHSLQSGFGWAKNPINQRIDLLDENIPVTLIYGSRSWIDHLPALFFKEHRPHSYLNPQVIAGAGHHVYADNVEEFNKIVSQACNHIKGYRWMHTINFRRLTYLLKKILI